MVAVLIIAGPLAALGGAELGADRATRAAEAEADRLVAGGRFPEAIAVNRSLAQRTGPLHLLSRGPVDAATLRTQAVLVDWARVLAGRGQVDQALFVLGGVTQNELVERAHQVRVAILLESARSAAAAQSFPVALQRLDQLRRESPPDAVAREADSLRPICDVGAAPRLARSGRAADAVVLLDDALSHAATPQTAAAARSALPSTLLAAARQSLEAQYRREAQSLLLRLQYDFSASREARSARTLLQAAQPVTGTLAQRRGIVVSGPVRLSGHFRSAGNSYLTSPPFYPATAGPSGDFVFAEVPPGGPYVLEIFSGGEWTTSIDPGTGRPANSFMVEQLIPVDLGFVVVS
ncbi:MAG: hypothetical protein ABR564_10190 [Candidatus Dormibacteria bacterium]